MDEREFTEALRQQLVTAAERRHDIPTAQPRRARRVWSAGIAAAAALTVVVGFGIWSDEQPVAADVRVSLDDDHLTLQLHGHDVRADEIVQAARAAGLDVSVSEVPVGPSNVGRLVRAQASELPPVLELIGPDGATFLGFRLPRGWNGTLRLTLGRAAQPGERYVATSDALLPGEPLACRDRIMGEDLATVAEELRAEGYSVRTFALPTPGDVTDLDPYRDWKVVKVEALGPDELWVDATVDGEWPFVEGEPQPSPDC